jgi:hypothetical protein
LTGVAAWAQQSHVPAKTEVRSADFAVTYGAEQTELVPGQCCTWLQGGGVDAAVSLWKGFGIAAGMTGDHASNVTPGVDVNTIKFWGGPRYTHTLWIGHATDKRRMQIFGQGLFGEVHGFDGVYPGTPTATSSANAFALETGGGLNVFLTKRFGLRLVEAEYVRTELPNNTTNVQNDLRLSAGLVYHIGEAPQPAVTLTATANPTAVYVGDPVALIATASNLNPKLNVVYRWSGSGVNGNAASMTVATATLAPGSYTVKAQVKEGKAGKEGLKPGQSAETSVTFTVKAFDPPTINCSTNPSSVNPGESATIAASAVSPQNRPLTYSYSTTAGSVSGTSSTATLSTAAASPGEIAVTCNVVDDKGNSVSARTGVTVIAPPPPPPLPLASSLCAVSFERDAKRPTRVDNEAKACLDDIALTLERSSDAKLALVGNASAKETPVDGDKNTAIFAAERAVNTKAYLATDKGIDASRILVYTGTDDGKTVTSMLIPAGAVNPVANNTPVDETTVKAQARKPLPMRRHPKQKRK